MVDNAWRDSFVIKNKSRIGREDHQAVEREDNSSLLELERRTNLAKPTGGDGLFAGTSFETTSQTTFIKSGLTISSSGINEEVYEQEEEPEETVGGKKESKRVTMINRATAVLEDLADRISSSGGANPNRRKGSREDEREKSTDSLVDRRKSTAPQRVKSVVARLSKVATRRKTRHAPMGEEGSDAELETEPESMYASENPQFTKS